MTEAMSQNLNGITKGRMEGSLIVLIFTNLFLHLLEDKILRKMIHLCVYLISYQNLNILICARLQKYFGKYKRYTVNSLGIEGFSISNTFEEIIPQY